MKTTTIISFIFLFLLISSFVVWDLNGESDISSNKEINNNLINQKQDLVDENKITKESKTRVKINPEKRKQKVEFESVKEYAQKNAGSVILGRPSDSSIAFNIIATKDMSASIEYGFFSGSYTKKTDTIISEEGDPIVIEIDKLNANTDYYYKVGYQTEKGEFKSINS